MAFIRSLFAQFQQQFQQIYSVHLLVLVLLLAAAVAYVVRNAKTMSSRRFVALSIVCGLLATLAIGAAYRVPLTFADRPAVIRLEQIRTVEKRALTRQAGTVERKTLSAALAALREMFAE